MHGNSISVLRQARVTAALRRARIQRQRDRRQPMRRRRRTEGAANVKKRFVIAALAALLVVAGTIAAKQKKDEPSTKVPRAADGHPDMTGVWQAGSNHIGTWEEANVDGGFIAGNSPITPFAIKEKQPSPPYQNWALEKVQESYVRRGVDDPEVAC